MKKYFSILVIALFVFVPDARADCLPGAPGCDLPATTAAQCTAVGGTWFNNQCLGATGITPGTISPSEAGGVNQQWLQYYYQLFLWVINSIFVPVLIAIAFIVFLWGVFKYFIWHRESESEKMEGRKYVLWGIIGFVVIISVWGLVNIVKSTFFPSTLNTQAPEYPRL